MSRDLDAAVSANLDPRLRLASDNSECFLCGRPLVRNNYVNVEYGEAQPLAAHSECCNNMPALDLFAAYWKALRAAVPGTRETPNPGEIKLFRGDFR